MVSILSKAWALEGRIFKRRFCSYGERKRGETAGGGDEGAGWRCVEMVKKEAGIYRKRGRRK